MVSTTNAGSPGNAWNVYLNDGSAVVDDKGLTNLVWPVRGGNRCFDALDALGGAGGYPISANLIDIEP